MFIQSWKNFCFCAIYHITFAFIWLDNKICIFKLDWPERHMTKVSITEIFYSKNKNKIKLGRLCIQLASLSALTSLILSHWLQNSENILFSHKASMEVMSCDSLTTEVTTFYSRRNQFYAFLCFNSMSLASTYQRVYASGLVIYIYGFPYFLWLPSQQYHISPPFPSTFLCNIPLPIPMQRFSIITRNPWQVFASLGQRF